ncbi:VOC family protein [Jannaschia sp. W003]|uniref:VOC family protein n=1 Tax=Jannaschia sp. W003 TaxID=2867012 RepID=UPI0021A80A5C|nr:VOC family protein [Jannaschia sp. W003]UWQ21029.1 VOC family protein [Jannaschia sp. W003]
MRLGHVALLVPDYDEALAFFVHGLGWRCTADEAQGAKRWVTVAPPGGGAGLVLARAEGAQVSAVGAQFGGRVGLFLHADDFAAAAQLIEAAGGRFEEAPRHEPYGTVAVWRDPWGNRWDLVSPAD